MQSREITRDFLNQQTNLQMTQIQTIKQEQMTLSVVSPSPRLQAFMGKAPMNCLEAPQMQGKKDFITSYYSTQNFKLKNIEYWEKGVENGFRVHYNKWMLLMNIRSFPDELTVNTLINCLKNDYGHLNENCITDAIKMNLRNEFTPHIEAYQLINENFMIKLLTAYNAKLLEAHRIAVKIRDEQNKPTDPTPEEIEAKNIKAMKDVFAEFKATGNENLISGLYYKFFDDRKLIPFSGEQKREFMKQAKEQLKGFKTHGENMRMADNITKAIDAGEMQDEVISLAKKITVIEYFKQTKNLPL